MDDLLSSIASSQARQQEQLVRIDNAVQSIQSRLFGNGRDGLIVRLDRLERAHRFIMRCVWIVLGAAATTISGWLILG